MERPDHCPSSRSNLMAPCPARLPHPKPNTIKPKGPRYERGTTGGQVIAAVRDRPSGLARERATHLVHFFTVALDNPTSVNCSLVPGSEGDAEVGASFRKGTALKFLGGVNDDLLRAAVRFP